MSEEKKIQELAKDIAIVAHPDTRDLVEKRALLVLETLIHSATDMMEKEAVEALRICESPDIPQTKNSLENLRIARMIERGDAMNAVENVIRKIRDDLTSPLGV